MQHETYVTIFTHFARTFAFAPGGVRIEDRGHQGN